MVKHIGVVAQQYIRMVEQVVEIHGSGHPAPLAVDVVYFGCGRP